MSYFRRLSLRNFDWPLLTAVIMLMSIGLVAIYSVDLSRGVELTFFKKQLLAVIIGVVLVFIISFSQNILWYNLAKWWYALTILSLILVLLFGNIIRGTRGWFVIAGFSFQPVEIVKLGLILLLAYIITNFGRRFERSLFFYGTALVAFLPVVLVLLQPDLGSAILLVSIWFGLMWITGARRLFIAVFILFMIAVSFIGWHFFLQDYQKDRLITFIDPSRDPLKEGYNINQSIIAIGSGKLFGRGLGFGSQSQLKFLPEAQTDFIFSVIGEELGLAGVMVLLTLFGIIFWRLSLMIKNSTDDFISITASGSLILFFTQFCTNISACIGLLPITGVTLPFVSSGGSSLVANLILIGILESMSKHAA
jgi:rod shape determining protein RodA